MINFVIFMYFPLFLIIIDATYTGSKSFVFPDPISLFDIKARIVFMTALCVTKITLLFACFFKIIFKPVIILF